VSSDRETTIYTVEVTRDHLETALQYLEKSVTGQVFKPWEIADSTPRVKIDLANVSDPVRAVELVHRAAYRTGLGNSIFCQKHKVGKISSEALQDFYNANFTANHAAVSGVNIDHNTLSGFAQSLQLGSGEGTKNQSTYHGGADLRLEKGGHTASVAVATSGGSWSNLQEGIAFMVLQQAAGVSPSVKWGNSAGVISKAVQAAAPNTGVVALNAGYSDSGLFGFTVSGPAKEAGQAVEAGIKALKSASLNDDDVARGKALLKSFIAFNYETEPSLLTELGVQSVLLGSPLSLKAALEAVDAIQASDVKNVSCLSVF
jgi:ubiquinol-cytochrome c reductase core subunit 2